MTTTQLTAIRKAIGVIKDMIRRHMNAIEFARKSGQVESTGFALIHNSTKYIAEAVESLLSQTDCYEDLKASREIQNAHNYLYQAVVKAGDEPNEDAFWHLIVGISGAMNELEHANAKAQLPIITAEDDRAIRRAVWSSFHRLGHCPCPYPVGHHHREIWAEEAAAIAAEFSDQLLPPAPVAEVIAWQDFEANFTDVLNTFAALPMGEVVDGEVIPMPEPPIKAEPEELEPVPAAARLSEKQIRAANTAAKRWRKQHTNVEGGVVVVHNNQASGWMNEIRNPEGWEPNCIAIAEDGRAWLSTGGDTYHGAKEWQPVTATA